MPALLAHRHGGGLGRTTTRVGRMVRLTIDGKDDRDGRGQDDPRGGQGARDLHSHPVLPREPPLHRLLPDLPRRGGRVRESHGLVRTRSCRKAWSVTHAVGQASSMRQDYLKLILAYHPLDCPICDAGGECDLQDLVFEHAIEKADYPVARQERIEALRDAPDQVLRKPLRPLPALHPRVQGDIGPQRARPRGDRHRRPDGAHEREELHLLRRVPLRLPRGGPHREPEPREGRLWQVERHLTTCPHCGFGCTFSLDVTANGYVTDVIQDVENMPNRGSLCVMGRFGYDFVNHEARIRSATDKGAELEPCRGRVRCGRAHGRPRQGREDHRLCRLPQGHERRDLHAQGDRRPLQEGPVRHLRLLPHGQGPGGVPPHGPLLPLRVRPASRCRPDHRRGGQPALEQPCPGRQGAGRRTSCGAAGSWSSTPRRPRLRAIADAHLKVLPGQRRRPLRRLDRSLSRRLAPEASRSRSSLARGLRRACGHRHRTSSSAHRALVSRAANIAVIFGSGICASDESLKSLLNFCVACRRRQERARHAGGEGGQRGRRRLHPRRRESRPTSLSQTRTCRASSSTRRTPSTT